METIGAKESVEEANDRLKQLGIRDRFRELIVDQIKCDVKFLIGLKQTDSIGAHKLIITTSSPVFEALVNAQSSEDDDGVIKITDVEMDVFKAVLMFIYTYKPELDLLIEPFSTNERMMKANDVIFAAKKFQIKELADQCVDYLKKEVNGINCLELAMRFTNARN